MNTNLPTLLFLFLGLTLLSTTTFSQKLENGGLVITGSVEKIGIGPGTNCIPSVMVYLQFRNDSDETLILLRPGPPIVRKVAFISTQVGDTAERTVNSEVFDRLALSGLKSSDSLASFLTWIDKPEPAKTSSISIKPGFSYEFHDELLIGSGFELKNKTNGQCDYSQRPTPKYQSFKVEYHLTVKKNDQTRELLEKLQQRWKPFGHLLLDSDGGITYRSSEILLSDGR